MKQAKNGRTRRAASTTRKMIRVGGVAVECADQSLVVWLRTPETLDGQDVELSVTVRIEKIVED